MSGVLSLVRIRARVRDAVRDLAGGTPSRYAPEDFGRDSRSLAHRAFSVALASSTAAEADRQLGRGGVPRAAFAATTVVVRTAYLLRTDSVDADYDAALEAEQELVAAVLRSAERDPSDPLEPMFAIRFRRVSSRVPIGGYLVATAEFDAAHTYELTLASERT